MSQLSPSQPDVALNSFSAKSQRMSGNLPPSMLWMKHNDDASAEGALSYKHYQNRSCAFEIDQHTCYLIVCQGSVTIDSSDTPYANGKIILINIGSVLNRISVSGAFSILEIDEAAQNCLLETISSQQPAQAARDFVVFTSKFLAELCRSLSRFGSEGISSSELDNLIATIGLIGLAEACRYNDDSKEDDCLKLPKWKLEKVKKFVRSNIDTNLNIALLARVCDYSPYHFCRLFKSASGQTPHQFIINERVKHACELLTDSVDSISTIAYECGFSSQSHMTMIFRRVLGNTPKNVRMESQQKLPVEVGSLAAVN